MGKRTEAKIPRKIDPLRDDDTCRADLERYRLLSIEMGASDAKIIQSDRVIVENRVRGKCIVPKCPSYGMSINCPPHSPSAEETRSMLKEYRFGVFIRLIVASDQMAGERASEEDRMGPFRMKIQEIVSKLESTAFYDGYHLAMGFAAGSCKRSFCPDIECNALAPGKGCRHPLWARPSMESVGMNVYTMAAKVGWEIYPIGKNVSLKDLPHGNYLGLVLVY